MKNAQILDGKKLANEIRSALKTEVETLKKSRGITPGLAVILVGGDPASELYVNMKAKACEEVGVYSVVHKMPADVRAADILDTLAMMNNNPFLDGILVQLPLPKHIDATPLLEKIAISKDVDGFHPHNFGRLVAGLETFAPCTPLGVTRLLSANKIDVKGMDACVVGASNIVGKPMAALLLNAGATVDICHVHTRDLAEHTRRADLLVVGVGKANLIAGDMITGGAIAIDIGINKIDGKVCGDIDYEAA
ncbi:MAG: bifunctional methylenetetrahydrofolate dehydrogenase/methenyltetrahydrofolate cyclohydrolase, partial [Helicobacteraceae bacterium]|nr:bifunctional methylenetetrahydrofolate dehydrogenase/methenyltetrahydrofolate cyclohydrolase [Helicobacteraceae bacterium]